MKKFTFTTEPSDEATEAVIDVTNTAPMDFVGRLMVSKLKIPRNTMPIALVPPLTRGFNQVQKNLIDQKNKVPTEFYYGILLLNTLRSAPSNDIGYHQTLEGGEIKWKVNRTPGSVNYQVQNAHTRSAIIITYWINESPSWKQENGLYYLTNQRHPIYSWTGEGNDLVTISYMKTYPESQATTLWGNIDNYYNKFVIETTVNVEWGEEDITTPTIGLSEWLIDINGLRATPMRYFFLANKGTATTNFSFDEDEDPTSDLYHGLSHRFLVMPAKVTYNLPFANTLTIGTRAPPLSTMLNMSATYDFLNFNQSDLLFPINHIAIQCLDLNYEPEDISVNTVNLEGVIVPSHMYFLKTFLISTRGGLSDFIYIQDLATANTIEVNSPRIFRLQFRFLWIDNDNIIHNFQIWRNNTITLQLTLLPFDSEPPSKMQKSVFS